METGDNSAHSLRPPKSAGAFRTISEVALDLDLPQHVLRFWETKFTSVKPMKRGGGRRYYRPEDVVLLKQIRSLLYDDRYTIKGVQKLLRDGGGKLANVKAQSSLSTKTSTEPSGTAPASDITDREKLTSLLNELEDIRAELQSANT
ncbi:MAG: MerR family transcriptional regulator [Rhodospirillales bacterium]|nr:MerR family transcriptional regulator [Rhodospirillales bacterium]